MLTISLKFKNSEIKTVETDKAEITIGRNPGNDIHIDNLGVSKQHAKIIKQDGNYVIEDLNSTNGTFINEKRVARASSREKGRRAFRSLFTGCCVLRAAEREKAIPG